MSAALSDNHSGQSLLHKFLPAVSYATLTPLQNSAYPTKTLQNDFQIGHDFDMSDYRRNRVPGGTYFFTVNLRDRRSQLLTVHIAELRDAVRRVRTKYPFHIDGWVVLPEHMHCIWTLPEGDDDYPARWKAIKTAFSKQIPNTEALSTAQAARGERGVWQHRYWEHTIRDDLDYERHMDYLHINPVKHGLVKRVANWPHSSFHKLVAAGIYAEDWAGYDGEIVLDAGEMVGG